MSIYETLQEAGVPLDNHESDLYAKVTDDSRAIIAKYAYRTNVRIFRSQIDGTLWYDIPFAYAPWWKRRQANAHADILSTQEGGQ